MDPIRAHQSTRHLNQLLVRAAALLATLSLGAPASAVDLFVNNVTGEDGRDGRSTVATATSGPVHSLTRALTLARTGDRIVMAKTDVPYHDSVTMFGARNSGNGVRPFVLQGNGATLDGSTVVPSSAWEHFRGDIFRFKPSRASYQQLFLDAKPARRKYFTALHARLPELEPLEWCAKDGYIFFRVEPTKLPADYRLSCAGERVGITLYQVRDVVIDDLTIQGFQLDGVNAHDGATDILLSGLTCRGNGRSGVAVCGASRVELDSCLLGDNGAAQLFTEGQSLTSLSDCRLLPGTAPEIVRRGGRIYREGERRDVPPKLTP